MSRAARAAEADETLLLDVTVNGYALGKIGEFALHRGALSATARELGDLGFRLPAGASGGSVPLSDFPDLHYKIDMANQRLAVTAPNRDLMPALLSAMGPEIHEHVQSSTGATLNYDLVMTQADDAWLLSGAFDARVFSPWGVLSSTELAGIGAAAQPFVRLESAYSFADVQDIRRYTAGDYINGGLSWSRPVRLGGLQVDTDFGIKPDLVTFPVPQIAGQVAVPSTVDVMVNGVQAFSHDVAPGPFQLQQLPIVTGAGTVSVAVDNALGQQTIQTLPFYASTSLLKPGLDSYSFELGVVRLDYGAISDDYGNPAASGSYRRGITPWLTLESHAEGTTGLGMGGVGAAVDVFDFGVFSASAAASGGSGQGWQVGAGFERVASVLSFSASGLFASHNFQDIAATEGDPVPTTQIRASVGLSLGPYGSFGATYSQIDRPASKIPQSFDSIAAFNSAPFISPTTLGTYFEPPSKVQLVALSYNRTITDNLYAYVTAYDDFADSHDYGGMAGIVITFGSRNSVNISGSGGPNQNYGSVQYSRSVSQVGDVGGQALAAFGTPARQFAELDYKSPYALLTAGADRNGGQTLYQATAQGAISVLDGGIFPSNTVYQSFAVVDTGDVPHVHVLQENRPAGETDSSGRLLVTDLRSYDANVIGIDPGDVPADADVGATTKRVRPRDRAGVIIRFPITQSRGAVLRLVDAKGVPIPVGASIGLVGQSAFAPVGYDGESYLEHLAPQNRAIVTLPDATRCAVSFAYHAQSGVLPTIGPLACQPVGGP